MTQEITVTNAGDHYEMQFDGGSSYPVPTNAIDKLDDGLVPENEGDSVTFRGEYGGHKHAKTFDVEEILDDGADEVPDEVPDAVPADAHSQGVAQQINAERFFGGFDWDEFSRRKAEMGAGN